MIRAVFIAFLTLCYAHAICAFAEPVPVRALILPPSADGLELRVLEPLIAQFNLDNPDIVLTVQLSATTLSADYEGIVESYLSSRSSAMDILMLDVVWPEDLADDLVDLQESVAPSTLDMYNPRNMDTCWIKSRLVALPYRSDYGLLFYRKDLLEKWGHEVPRTWDDLAVTASDIVLKEQAAQRNPNLLLAGFLAQYNAGEGLTCDVMEYLRSCAGGSVIELDGRLSLSRGNPERDQAIMMLEKVRSWIASESVSPQYSLVYDESEGLADWIAGTAVFLRSWPYVVPQSRAANVSFDFGWSPLPGCVAGQSASTLGGWNLGVTKYSKHIPEAIRALKFLTSEVVQRARALQQASLPTISALYNVTRPAAQSAPYYSQVTESIFTNVHNSLTGELSAVAAVDAIVSDIAKILSIDLLGLPITVRFSDRLGLLFVSLSGMSLLLIFLIAITIVTKRDVEIIKKGSWPFMLVMLTGLALGMACIFVYTGIPTEVTCVLESWLVSCAFGLTISSLLVKNFRIYKIFNNRRHRVVGLSTRYLVLQCACLMSGEVILLTLWSVLDRPRPVWIELSNSRFWSCRSVSERTNWIFTGLLFGYNAFLVLCGVFLAYRTRHVQLKELNEAKFIGLSIYSIVLTSLVTIPITYTSYLGVRVIYAMRALGILMTTATILVCMFGPKLFVLVRDTVYPASLEDLNTVGLGPPMLMSIITGKQTAPRSSIIRKRTSVRRTAGRYLEATRSGELSLRHSRSRLLLPFAPWETFDVHLTVRDKLLCLAVPPDLVQTADRLGKSVYILTDVTASVIGVPNRAREEGNEEGSDDLYLFETVFNGRVWQWQADSKAEMDDWIAAFTVREELSGAGEPGNEVDDDDNEAVGKEMGTDDYELSTDSDPLPLATAPLDDSEFPGMSTETVIEVHVNDSNGTSP
ncbi:hypothetical protein HKX48_004566 [Thoreauomyces humboldtii]|nr:hypothetical protein HKX48_004566 [Thoreauomyces humboldtii]